MVTWRNKHAAAERTVAAMLKASTIVVFDVETTGTDAEKSKIIQFSAIKYQIAADLSLHEIDSRNFYINPHQNLPAKITKITGITTEMVRMASDEFDMAPLIFRYMATADLWAAYNAEFDYRMLQSMAKQTKYEMPKRLVLDVLSAARDCFPCRDSYHLSDVVTDVFPDECFKYHDSMEDVKATAMLVSRCLDEYKKALTEYNEPDAKIKVRLISGNCQYNQIAGRQQRIKVLLECDTFTKEMEDIRKEYKEKNLARLKEKRENYIRENLSLLQSYDEQKRRRVLDLDSFIPLELSSSTYGRIYWDVIRKCWGCKTDKYSRHLFDMIDLEDLEEQMLSRYGRSFHKKSMEGIGKAWLDLAKKKVS